MAYIKDQSHGNYRHYYVRRRANDQYALPLERDERLNLLDSSLFKGKTVLDVGCNSGEVSVELAQRYQPAKVVGVDIDSALIDLCQSTTEHAFSLHKPLIPLDQLEEHSRPPLQPAIVESPVREPSRKKRKLKNGAAHDAQETSPSQEPDAHYFPAFFPQLFGTINIQGASLLASVPSNQVAGPGLDEASPSISVISHREEGGLPGLRGVTNSAETRPLPFPKNLVFYAADWTNTSVETDTDGYDVILGFSLTKWIHLHGLDEGLIRFFQKCYDTLHEGGVLILEKQGWKGYKQAKRSSEALRHNYNLLKLRPETDFDRILLETIGFSKKETVKEAETEKGFDRDIEMYWK